MRNINEIVELQPGTVSNSPQLTQPSPVPTTFQISDVTNEETQEKSIMLAIFTATGQSVYFLDSDMAKAVGESLLIKVVKLAASEII